MTEKEMFENTLQTVVVNGKRLIDYIEENYTPKEQVRDKKYFEEVNEYYNKLSNEDGYIKVSELVERFKEVDDYYNNSDWNLLQILSNINLFIPISKKEIITEAFNEVIERLNNEGENNNED